MSAKLDRLDFAALKADVEPFLERREDLAAMSLENFRALLGPS